VRAVIADDSVLFREGLVRLLTEAGIEVAGEAGDGEGLVELAEATSPDVAIVDIRMPPTHQDEGLVAAKAIRDRQPQVSVLVLSQYVEASYALRLLNEQQGHCGYLLKDRVLKTADLIDAIERVVEGDLVVDRELVDELLERRRKADPLADLSSREREVLALMAEGLTDRGIAQRLWISPATVETHVRHILQKLSLPAGTTDNRRVHAVLAYLRS
jgi:DNA-binding NarL/FixJ family response regulator